MLRTDAINIIIKERPVLLTDTIKVYKFNYPKPRSIERANKRVITAKYTKRGTLTSALFVIRLGLEPKTPTLKVLCSTS